MMTEFNIICMRYEKCKEIVQVYSSPFFVFWLQAWPNGYSCNPSYNQSESLFGGIMSWKFVEWIFCNVEKIRMHWSNAWYADTYQLPLFRPFRPWNGLGSKSERQTLSPTRKRTASFRYCSLALLLHRPRACWLPPIVAAQHSRRQPSFCDFSTLVKLHDNR